MLDLVDADDPNRGLCGVVFVGVPPTAAQKLQLQDYSRKFKVFYATLQADGWPPVSEPNLGQGRCSTIDLSFSFWHTTGSGHSGVFCGVRMRV